MNHHRHRACSKRPVQQDRRPFGARSVLIVREHDKGPRTQLAAFLNILLEIFHAAKPRMRIRIPLAKPISERPTQQARGRCGGSAFDDEVIVIKESA